MTAAPIPPPADFDAGRYRVDGVLGEGAMGIVYRVHDERRGIDVALKTLRHVTPGRVRALKREFRALAGLRHPHLVQLYELQADDAVVFFTMELADGPALERRIRTPCGTLDVRQLRALAAELALGLEALHAAGRLHRDVKPTNVACSCDGRALLLDFGLAAVMGSADPAGSQIVGTPAWAAPEQLWGGPVGPSADWYAFGAVLHHLATGAAPWSGPPALIASRKLGGAGPLAARLRAVLPEDLADLVVGLLAPRPEDRPAPATVRRVLGDVAAGSRPLARPSGFIGRRRELDTLAQAFRRTLTGAASIVRVTGPSGIGKSALVERFLAGLPAGATVLRGRCHPYEHVRFNALDGLVDDLARVLADLAPGSVAVPHPGALGRLFPVLARVPALRALDPSPLPPDPVGVRRQAFGSLRRLLIETSARGPTVAWIDDLQWADEDSHALLGDLLAVPGAPRVLLVVTARPDAVEPAWCAPSWERTVRTITLGPLGDDEITDLVEAMLEPDTGSTDVVAAIRHAAAGSPFVAAQLAADAATVRDAAAAGAIDAGALLASRLGALAETERRILEVTALGARPLPRSQVLEAAGLPAAAELAVLGLETDRLLRTVTPGDAHTIEPYHDRIREAVLGSLDDAGRRARHGALARTLERAPDFDPDEVFVHYGEAGDVAGALRHGEAAGDQAAGATAFERAARRYRETLALVAAPADRLRLLEKLGDAEANAGRCGDAGATFERAADLARIPGEPERRLRLRYRRAIEFLHGGRLDRGLAAVADVLADAGVAVPSTQLGRLARLLAQRGRLAMRRPGRVNATARDVSDPRLEVLARLGLTVAMYDPILADVIVTRHCLEALAAADPAQIAVGLATDAAKSAQFGRRAFRARSRRLFAHVDRLASETAVGDPYWRAYLAGARVVALYEEGRWRACHEGARATRASFAAHCRGVSWEIATFDAYALTTLAHMGRFEEARAALPAALGDAEARGDLYAAVGLRSSALSLVWLAEDRPAEFVAELAAAMRRFPAAERFGIQDYLHVIAAVQAALYVGDGHRAWDLLAREWPRARRAGFFLLETPTIELRGLRARTALLRLAREGHDPHRGEGPRLLRVARRDARRIARADVCWAPAAAAMLDAGIAGATGSADAVAGYAAAAARYDATDMTAHAAACRECAAIGGAVSPLARALTGRA